jgi:hypothetical protein
MLRQIRGSEVRRTGGDAAASADGEIAQRPPREARGGRHDAFGGQVLEVS